GRHRHRQLPDRVHAGRLIRATREGRFFRAQPAHAPPRMRGGASCICRRSDEPSSALEATGTRGRAHHGGVVTGRTTRTCSRSVLRVVVVAPNGALPVTEPPTRGTVVGVAERAPSPARRAGAKANLRRRKRFSPR